MMEFISTKHLIWFLSGVLIPVNIIILYKYFITDLQPETLFTKLSSNQTDSTSKNQNHTIFGNFQVSGRNLTVLLPEHEERCVLPKLIPWDPVVLEELSEIPDKVICETKEHPLIFKTDLDSNLVVVSCPLQFALESCCYKKIISNESYLDGPPSYAKDCVRLRNTTTKIPFDIENIGVFCKKIEDTYATTAKPTTKAAESSTKSSTRNTSTVASKVQTSTTPTPLPEDPLKIIDILPLLRLKPDVEERILKMTNVPKDSDAFSVVILGLDSISHMHFIRTMPKTLRYITEDLHAVGLNGYVSVGGSTRPNIFAGFTGYNEEELAKICLNNTELNLDTSFDTCPFVWKNFSTQGYRTSYGEDTDRITAFNYNTAGFFRQPTDYYLHTLMQAQRLAISHRKDLNAEMCHGPRMVLDILLDHMLDIATIMEKRKYIQFIWSNSMTHDFPNNPMLIDDSVYLAIKRMKEEGHLDNKVFIFMSDHGYRWAEYRNSYQGQIEVRMPFFYVVLPEAFTKRYPEMTANLRLNVNRLTSPFDLYVTLLQLSTLASAGNEDNSIRRFYMRWLRPPTPTKKNYTAEIPSKGRGISLFDRIPLNRTCESAGIPDHYCICHNMTKIPSNETEVLEAAQNFVLYINTRLKNFPQCLKLTLRNVSETFNLLHLAGNTPENVRRIRFFVETIPGNAKFEATMSRNADKVWSRVSDNRVNLYGDTSHCVTDQKMKNYCYCLKQIQKQKQV